MTEAVLGYLYFAALFGLEEMKNVRFLVTPEEVSEEEFLAAWDERYRQVRERAARNMRAQAEERGKRIRAAAGGQDEGTDPDGEGG